MNIPEKIQIGGVTWDIVKDNGAMDRARRYGECNYSLSIINYQDEVDGKKRKKGAIEETVIHELLHAVLNSVGEIDLSSNEKFVSQTSGLLHQIINQLI